jgi:SAM-dependent methyltransferase
LEAGSGAGRFTEILLKSGAALDSFVYSAAVDANAINNGAQPFTLVQADIRAMPFEPNSYDFVVCLGVLQHTPDTEESIAKLWEMVRPGGRLVIDHYRWNLWLRLPPPIGNAEKLYRRVLLGLPPEKRCQRSKKSLISGSLFTGVFATTAGFSAFSSVSPASISIMGSCRSVPASSITNGPCSTPTME